MDALNRDPFWYVVNPEQHAQVIDQERLDYLWRAKQTPWYELLDRLPEWAFLVQFEKDTRNVTRKSAREALRRVLDRNSQNVLDDHLVRLQAQAFCAVSTTGSTGSISHMPGPQFSGQARPCRLS
jgi:hypothetical protein